MAIAIGSNISSLQAQRRLSENSSVLSRTYERLSTGQRINRASDDAAGLAICDSLRNANSLYNAAQRNINDAVSASHIIDSALSQQQAILNRLSELAEQSANGVYTDEQRAALNKEYRALGSEIIRIADTTAFNGIKLLAGKRSGSPASLAVQAGVDGSGDSQISLQAADTGLFSGTLGLQQSAIPGRDFQSPVDLTSFRLALAAGAGLDEISSLCAGAIASTSVKDSSGAEREVHVALLWGYSTPLKNGYTFLNFSFYKNESGAFAEAGYKNYSFNLGLTPPVEASINLSFSDTATTATLSLDYRAMDFKQLANGPVQNTAIDFTGVETVSRARSALTTIANRRSELSLIQSEVGAMQSRFDAALAVASISGANAKAAESRIRDADIADESANLTKAGILQQVASSVLAQANQAPALALQLLRAG